MLTDNEASRYHIAISALRAIVPTVPKVASVSHEFIANYQTILVDHKKYVRQWGKDPDHLAKIPTFEHPEK